MPADAVQDLSERRPGERLLRVLAAERVREALAEHGVSGPEVRARDLAPSIEVAPLARDALRRPQRLSLGLSRVDPRERLAHRPAVEPSKQASRLIDLPPLPAVCRDADGHGAAPRRPVLEALEKRRHPLDVREGLGVLAPGFALRRAVEPDRYREERVEVRAAKEHRVKTADELRTRERVGTPGALVHVVPEVPVRAGERPVPLIEARPAKTHRAVHGVQDGPRELPVVALSPPPHHLDRTEELRERPGALPQALPERRLAIPVIQRPRGERPDRKRNRLHAPRRRRPPAPATTPRASARSRGRVRARARAAARRG